ncbi:VaFE repeat-containing surface-anchored protein [Microbacterium galbinum]|uniref:VaFE repeat-containing surface-anchored protein n=1 Tax=Microbacterium galbinum TaxID=2851646 RepID=A0ABY4ITV1_9MICO|nr:VaFE repeat-containing surface-anchored protein [Microbacterium galbinum]
MDGELFDKVTAAGASITGQTTFTPAQADGSVSVDFVIPKDFAGRTLVAFQSVTADGVTVAEHTDIDAVAQTVVVEDIAPTDPLSTPPIHPWTRLIRRWIRLIRRWIPRTRPCSRLIRPSIRRSPPTREPHR